MAKQLGTIANRLRFRQCLKRVIDNENDRVEAGWRPSCAAEGSSGARLPSALVDAAPDATLAAAKPDALQLACCSDEQIEAAVERCLDDITPGEVESSGDDMVDSSSGPSSSSDGGAGGRGPSDAPPCAWWIDKTMLRFQILSRHRFHELLCAATGIKMNEHSMFTYISQDPVSTKELDRLREGRPSAFRDYWLELGLTAMMKIYKVPRSSDVFEFRPFASKNGGAARDAAPIVETGTVEGRVARPVTRRMLHELKANAMSPTSVTSTVSSGPTRQSASAVADADMESDEVGDSVDEYLVAGVEDTVPDPMAAVAFGLSYESTVGHDSGAAAGRLEGFMSQSPSAGVSASAGRPHSLSNPW